MPFDMRHPDDFPASASPAPAPRGFRALVGRIRRWRQLARQRKELAGLDPRLLRDIGVAAEDAAIEARRPFWHDPKFDPPARAKTPPRTFGYRFVGQLARLQERRPVR